ncbi:MAG TPA: hypothetical protein VF355_04870 [Anaerolineaceae bacterium]
MNDNIRLTKFFVASALFFIWVTVQGALQAQQAVHDFFLLRRLPTSPERMSAPIKRAAKISAATLVMNGTAIPFMLETATTLAKAIPNAQQRTLEGQRHDVNLEVLAPQLVEFFTK